MENNIVTWLIVAGLILLQFIGSNKKRKAAEAKRKAILEEQMRQAANTPGYGYDISSEEDMVYDETPEELQYDESIKINEKHSEDPFDFFNLSKIIEKAEVAMSANKSYFDIEERLSGKSDTRENHVPSVEAETYEQNYYNDSVESGVVIGETVLEGVRVTEDDADAIGGINDEAGLYSEEYESSDKVSPVVASFDPKLFILYSEIARPKFQE